MLLACAKFLFPVNQPAKAAHAFNCIGLEVGDSPGFPTIFYMSPHSADIQKVPAT